MALPDNLSYTYITGRFLRAVNDTDDSDAYPDGVPISGLTITFTPDITPARVKSATSDPPVTLTLGVLTANTDAEGDVITPAGPTKGIYILSSDDPDLSPNGWTYKVKIVGTGFPEISFSFIAHSGATMDLTSLVPVPVNPGAAIAPWAQVVAQATEAAASAAASADDAEAAAVAAEAAQAAAEEAAAGAGGGGTVPDGVVAYRGAWSASPAEPYAEPDLVLHNGQVYMLIGGSAGTETPGTGTNWRLITEQTSSYFSSYAGVLVANSGTFRLYNDSGHTKTILRVRGSVGTAPVGQSVVLDVNLDGTTIFTNPANRPTIAAGSYTGVSPTPDVQSWPDGSYLTFDIDQVGTTASGADLTVSVIVRG